MGRQYRNLLAWQKADELLMQIYQATKEFPKEEMYGLTSQIRRAALSVPTNIAEGMARKTTKDKAHFLMIAESSLNEVEYLIDVAHRLGYLREEPSVKLIAIRTETAKILRGLTLKIETTPENLQLVA